MLLTDNGDAYKSVALASWCSAWGVLHLWSLPRTPQHNGASENGMHGLKLNSGLNDSRAVIDIGDARERLVAARDRIDGHRLRASRGWRTARQADRENGHWSLLVGRQTVLEKVACAREELLLHSNGARARRRAEREAILGVLQLRVSPS